MNRFLIAARNTLLVVVAALGVGVLGAYVINSVGEPRIAVSEQLAPGDFTPIRDRIGADLTPRSYIVRVRYTRPVADMETFTSTGSFIQDDLVLTNFHAVREGDKGGVTKNPVKVELADGRVITGKVLKHSREKDLALIQVEGAKQLTYVRFAYQNPAKGDTLTVCGWALGKKYREIGGKVNKSYSTSKGFPSKDDVFDLNRPCIQGMSGGPALDTEGKLAAILFGSTTEAHVVGIETIKEFLEGTPYTPCCGD